MDAADQADCFTKTRTNRGNIADEAFTSFSQFNRLPAGLTEVHGDVLQYRFTPDHEKR